MKTAAVKILLVEDSPSDAEVLQETLRHAGMGSFEFTWVERLEEALARLRGDAYDVLLLDLSLPDSSGPDTFRRVQKAAPRLPIVVMTGLIDDSAGLAAVHEGVQDYLVKGQADGRQIALAVRYAIERKRVEEERRATIELLSLVNGSSGVRELIRAAAAFFQRQSGCDAVGVRLREGEDYPYFETLGFAPRVVACEGEAGCMCRRVISGEVAASESCFTAHGSFWTASQGLAACRNAEGYQSQALIPLRAGDARLGLLQLNGRREGLFSAEAVAFWERLADQVAVAVAKLRAEEALVRAKEEWERTFDAVPDMVVILDDRHRIVRANRATAERMGMEPAAAVGLHCFACVHGMNHAPDFCPHTLTLSDGEEHIAEVHEARLRGDFLVSTTPLRDGQGRMAGSVHVARDITQRKRDEEALRESQHDLNRAQAVAKTGSWRLDIRRDELRWSDETYRLFGIPKGTALTYEAFLAVVHPQDREFVDRSWQAALAGAPYDIEHRIVAGNRVKWLREKAELEFDAEGALLGGFGTVQDITERKLTEEKIRHQNAILEGVNRILGEALTCESEAELGRVCAAVAKEVTGSAFGYFGEINAWGGLDGAAAGDAGRESEAMCVRVASEGEALLAGQPAAFLGVPLKHDGKTIGVLAAGGREGGYEPRDVEAMEALSLAVAQVFLRKRAERAMQESEERLRHVQRMESVGLLAGGIAHDFNNLLTGIMGNASLLQNEVREESRGKLDAVIQAAERAADLTRQLLAYAGKGRFLIERLDLSLVVRQMMDLLAASIPKKVALTLKPAPDLPGIEADRGQMQQIAMNLIINAAEAVGENQTGTVVVTTSAREIGAGDRVRDEVAKGWLAPGRYVCLEVEDSGCGMDAKTRARIFEPFYTTKFTGRGLGLAAVAGIVHAHRGAIQIETEPGKGTAFRVFLPAGAAAEAAEASPRKAEQNGAGTILVVDDEPMVREFALHALEKRGYRVLAARNGREAVSIFEEHAGQIALVLLDLTMPVAGGDEAIGALKDKRPEVKVVVMSGYSEREVQEKFEGKGVSGYLQKPFTGTQLAEEVQAVLAGR